MPKKLKRKVKKSTPPKEVDNESSNTQLVQQDSKNIDELTKKAGEMWDKLKQTVKEKDDFIHMPDDKKLEHFREKLGYSEFMTEFPIVSRYMICSGQYSKRAFVRFLEGIKLSNKNAPPPTQRPKGYMEDLWIRNRANYVRYLWEAYQRGSHPDIKEAMEVWNDTYKKLKGEFDTFKDTYEETKKKTKDEKKILHASSARDLIERLKEGTQFLNKEDSEDLLNMLRYIHKKRRYKNCLKQLLERTPRIKESTSMYGTQSEDNENNKITMIETVSEKAYENIPDKYKMTKEEMNKLPTISE
jgi:hypothetical protein